MSELTDASGRFPADFLWGAATSAYQIEGAPLEDGAGPSIWHRFVHTPGLMASGDTGDVACDHYHRYLEDVALMRDIGLNAYRFSIAWSRIFPEGTGRVNRRGLAFYDRLIDALLEEGIQPFVTLYHWDLPAALDDRGGWLNRDVAGWFADYATALYRAFDDRVPMWATLNEPWVVMDGGYLRGALAPGHRNLFEAPIAAHNLLRAHGAAVQAYRAVGRNRVGLVVNLEPKYPASESAEDLAAVQRADAYMNRQYLDPVFRGSYPDEMREIFGQAWPAFPSADFALIREPIDFLGINYYLRGVTKDDPAALPVRARYGDIPLYITENGAAFYDPPSTVDGHVDDPLRVWYYREHLRAALYAIREGVDLRGYFAWSLLDNFEWSLGYAKRFGIVHVDYHSLKRTPKSSALFYADVIRTNGMALFDVLDAETPAAV